MRTRTDRRAFLGQGVGVVSLVALGCGGVDRGARASGTGTGGASAGGADGLGGTAGRGAAGGGDIRGIAGSGSTPDAGSAVCELTHPDIEGPFFKPASPERQNLVQQDAGGTYLVVHGQVLDEDCTPIVNAVLDFWQADDDGAYDNAGFGFRGHQRVDAEGRYELHTLVPGRYMNGSQYRPAHIHVKVYVGEREALTTQLYFSGDPFNAVDPWFSEKTMLHPVSREGGLVAAYDFVVARTAIPVEARDGAL